MDCQGALAAAIVVAGAFYIVNGKLGGKIYSTTNYIKNRYGQKLSAYTSSLKIIKNNHLICRFLLLYVSTYDLAV